VTRHGLGNEEVDVNFFNPWSNATEWCDGIPPETYLHDAEVLTLLLDEVKHQGMVVVEVGSWVGNGSTRVIVESIRDVGGILYCVDTWTGSDNVQHHRDYRDRHADLFRVFSDNVRGYGAENIVRPLIMPSVEASRLFPNESVDLVFIDGNHGYSHAKQDILAWLPKAKGGAILCGHDCDVNYAELDEQLRQAIEAQCEEDVFENVHFPGPPAFHAGVVKAVHEVFGAGVKRWFEVNSDTTVWSYHKPRPMTRSSRLRALLRSRLPFASVVSRLLDDWRLRQSTARAARLAAPTNCELQRATSIRRRERQTAPGGV
jgi:hypothetical protein